MDCSTAPELPSTMIEAKAGCSSRALRDDAHGAGAVAARVGAIGGEMMAVVTVISPRANPQHARGSQGCAKHELPRPIFCLDHRFVRRNCAQPTGDGSLRERPSELSFAAGWPIRPLF